MIINYKNLETIKKGHISDTVVFAVALANELGCSEAEKKDLETAAAFHDIGKVLIPSTYLNKNGALTPEERKIVNHHAYLGYEIMKALGYSVSVAVAVRDHHNPYSTSKIAQILRMADIYSAMTEQRPYKTAKSHEEAMSVLKNCHFSQELLAAGERILKLKRAEITAKAKKGLFAA